MVKIPILTVHHRRPTALGGKDLPFNISYIENTVHVNWGTLVGNMNAYQIADHLNQIEGFNQPKKKLLCKFINGKECIKKGNHHSKNPNKIKKALRILFEEMCYEDKIAYINNVLLDPSYRFYIIDI